MQMKNNYLSKAIQSFSQYICKSNTWNLSSFVFSFDVWKILENARN